VGSNALVVKDVPPAATAMGILAHIVAKDQSGSKSGFTAYAISKDVNDPVVKAIREFIDTAGTRTGALRNYLNLRNKNSNRRHGTSGETGLREPQAHC
jgi:hypothetical protein